MTGLPADSSPPSSAPSFRQRYRRPALLLLLMMLALLAVSVAQKYAERRAAMRAETALQSVAHEEIYAPSPPAAAAPPESRETAHARAISPHPGEEWLEEEENEPAEPQLPTALAAETQIDAVKSSIAAHERHVLGLEQRLQQLEEKLTRLSESKAKAEGQTMVALALAQLQQAVERGDGFAPQLRRVHALAATEQEILEVLAPLSPFAERGVPTQMALAQQLEALIPDALAASRQSGNPSWWERFAAHLSRVIVVRRIGTPSGQSAEEVLARIESAVRAGEFSRAAQEVEHAPPAVKNILQPWNEGLKTRAALAEIFLRAQTALINGGAPPSSLKESAL